MKDWRFITTNKLKGASGETDFSKKTIKINKKIAETPGYAGFSKEESTLINTITHEMLHKSHPGMLEKTVRRIAKARVRIMSPKAKARLYNKFN